MAGLLQVVVALWVRCGAPGPALLLHLAPASSLAELSAEQSNSYFYRWTAALQALRVERQHRLWPQRRVCEPATHVNLFMGFLNSTGKFRPRSVKQSAYYDSNSHVTHICSEKGPYPLKGVQAAHHFACVAVAWLHLNFGQMCIYHMLKHNSRCALPAIM